MRPAAARAVANLVMVSAGLAVAYAVVTTPPLLRLARGALWLGVRTPRRIAGLRRVLKVLT